MPTDKRIYATCVSHPGCTVEYNFVPNDAPNHDPVVDRKPVPDKVGLMAVAEFGECYCVETNHKPGELRVMREH